MRRLRAAIVGAGLMGRWHAHAARKVGAEVVAVVDPRSAAARALHRRFSRARVFTDLDDCLASCPADVVHVCTPAESHVELAELALRAGKAVLVEKPLAPSAQDTERLLRLAKSKNLKLNPVHQFPFQRGFQHVQRGTKDCGDLVRVSFHLCSAGGTGRSDADCRALLLEILPHPLSVFCSLFGNGFAKVSWTILRFTAQDLEMNGIVNNTLLEVRLSLRGRPPRNELTVVGTRGTGRVDFFHGYSILERGGTARRSKLLLPFRSSLSLLTAAAANLTYRALRAEWAYPGLRTLIGRFYQSIHNDRAAPISDEEILLISRFIDRLAGAKPADTFRAS